MTLRSVSGVLPPHDSHPLSLDVLLCCFTGKIARDNTNAEIKYGSRASSTSFANIHALVLDAIKLLKECRHVIHCDLCASSSRIVGGHDASVVQGHQGGANIPAQCVSSQSPREHQAELYV
jgi:hypothetical protein